MLTAILILCAVGALDAAPLAAKTVATADELVTLTPNDLEATNALLGKVTKGKKYEKFKSELPPDSSAVFPTKKSLVLPVKTTPDVEIFPATTAPLVAESEATTPVAEVETTTPVALPTTVKSVVLIAAPPAAERETTAVVGWPAEVLKARLEQPFAKPLFEDHKARSFDHSALLGFTYFF